jgi:hypothetical protein
MGTAQMRDLHEKRLDVRHDCEAIIKWSYFNKDLSGSDKSYYGVGLRYPFPD